jgi:hypothetical protein
MAQVQQIVPTLALDFILISTSTTITTTTIIIL